MIAETANRFICPRVVVATVAVIEVTQAAFAHFPRQAASAVLTALVVVAAIGILEYQVQCDATLRAWPFVVHLVCSRMSHTTVRHVPCPCL